MLFERFYCRIIFSIKKVLAAQPKHRPIVPRVFFRGQLEQREAPGFRL